MDPYSLFCTCHGDLPEVPNIVWTSDSEWSSHKILQNSIGEFGFHCPDLYERIATRLPGKTVLQVKECFDYIWAVVEAIEAIERKRGISIGEGETSDEESIGEGETSDEESIGQGETSGDTKPPLVQNQESNNLGMFQFNYLFFVFFHNSNFH
jgi:hypothetical protein